MLNGTELLADALGGTNARKAHARNPAFHAREARTVPRQPSPPLRRTRTAQGAVGRTAPAFRRPL